MRENTLTVVISQSGETADTLAALREAKRLGSRTLAVVNVLGSSIAREADDVLYTLAGPEIAVATTKGYTTQVAALYLIGLFFAEKIGSVSPEQYRGALDSLKKLPEAVGEILSAPEKSNTSPRSTPARATRSLSAEAWTTLPLSRAR